MPIKYTALRFLVFSFFKKMAQRVIKNPHQTENFFHFEMHNCVPSFK